MQSKLSIVALAAFIYPYVFKGNEFAERKYRKDARCLCRDDRLSMISIFCLTYTSLISSLKLQFFVSTGNSEFSTDTT